MIGNWQKGLRVAINRLCFCRFWPWSGSSSADDFMAAIMVRERKQDFGLFTAVRDTHTAGELEHCTFAPREQTEIASPGSLSRSSTTILPTGDGLEQMSEVPGRP